MNSSRKYLHPPHPCWEGVFLLWLPSSLDFPKSAHKIDPLPTGNSIYVAHLLLGIFRKRYRRRSLGIIHLELYLYLHQSSRNLRWYSNMATGSNATFHENDLYRKFNFIILKKKKKTVTKNRHPSHEECREKGGVLMSIILPNLNHSFICLVPFPFPVSFSGFLLPPGTAPSLKTCFNLDRI